MKQPKTIQLDRQKILKQLTSLSKLLESGRWKLEYDADVDELFFGKEVIPKGSFLYNINDELNLFVTETSTVNGIFVEYFANNYIEHNKNLKPVLKALESGNAKNGSKNKLVKEALEEKLLNQAIGSVFKKKKLLAAVV